MNLLQQKQSYWLVNIFLYYTLFRNLNLICVQIDKKITILRNKLNIFVSQNCVDLRTHLYFTSYEISTNKFQKRVWECEVKKTQTRTRFKLQTSVILLE